ncbi:sugar porter family MFS transporter [Alistipes provencensis]|uniref:sugar porter family MFS transporter n=1 Tax=Alistipes provencensis TaxID=1816676 RepID=UPI0007EC5FE0|nr:sugar porter family MFS transporter [Alistipes provencensis]
MKGIGYILFLSAAAALGGFLFGYDTAVISGTISMVTAQFGLNVTLQGWYVGCALVGSIAGVSFAGMLSDRFGRKISLSLAALFFTVSAAGCAVSADITQLIVYRIIGGVGIGVASIISPMYISEIAVAKHRGRLVSLYQLAITIGFLAAYIVNYALLNYAGQGTPSDSLWSKVFVTEPWRSMLGAETLPALIFLAILFFIPESPRWLVARGRTDCALAIQTRISGSEADARGELGQTIERIEREKGSEWKFLLRPNMLKAVAIGAAIAILGQFMGVNAVLYYGPSIFEQSGLSAGDSLFYQVLVGLVNMLTTVVALVIIDKVGRKKLVYFGVSGMILSLLAISWYFTFGAGMSSIFLLVFFLLYIFFCAISISAVIFVLLSEMYPTKVRGLAMSIAGLSLWVGTYLIGQLTPWLLERLLPQGTFLLFAVMCIPYILIIRFLVPETTGKTLEQIEQYWEEKA